MNKLINMGADKNRLQAMVFGGAHVISQIPAENGIGLKNAESILNFLQKEQIKIINHDLGGFDARKITFYTDTGEVEQEKIKSSAACRLTD